MPSAFIIQRLQLYSLRRSQSHFEIMTEKCAPRPWVHQWTMLGNEQFA